MILKFLKAILMTKKFLEVKTSRRPTTSKQRIQCIKIGWEHVYTMHNGLSKFGKD